MKIAIPLFPHDIFAFLFQCLHPCLMGIPAHYTWICLEIPFIPFTNRRYSGILCEMLRLGEGGEKLKQVVVCIKVSVFIPCYLLLVCQNHIYMMYHVLFGGLPAIKGFSKLYLQSCRTSLELFGKALDLLGNFA